MKDENIIFKTIQIRIKLLTFMFCSLVLVKKKKKKKDTTELTAKCGAICHPCWC